MENDSFRKTAVRVSVITIMVNLLLTLFKLAAGLFAGSQAMVSDAVHSASDVLSTFIVIIGVNISSKKSDKSHQYGHERYESVASVVLAALLLTTGLMIGYNGIMKITAGAEAETPGMLALVAAVTSIVVKEWMYWYTRIAAKKTGSTSLMADAWHHRSDAFSSVGALAGIIGARMGFAVLDSVASVVICAFIVKVALDIFARAVDGLVDKTSGDETENAIRELAAKQMGVLGVDSVKTRLFGSKIYVDMEICADGNLTLGESHRIAENVHDAIEREMPAVKHCMVHVNPAERE